MVFVIYRNTEVLSLCRDSFKNFFFHGRFLINPNNSALQRHFLQNMVFIYSSGREILHD
jgi:hypothetical protein